MTTDLGESDEQFEKRKPGSGILQHFTVQIILHVFGSCTKRVLLGVYRKTLIGKMT